MNDYEFRKVVCSITGDTPINNIEDIPRDKVDWDWFAKCIGGLSNRYTVDDYIALQLTEDEVKLIASGKRRKRLDVIKYSTWMGRGVESGYEWVHKDQVARRNEYNKKE